MRRFSLVLAALVAVSVVVATATASTKITAPPTTYTSPSGNAGTAPDIVGASATNDDHGLYTITTTFGTTFASNSILLAYLDADRNHSTGDSDGDDYLIIGAQGDSSLSQWSTSANDFVDAPSESTLTFSIAPDGRSATITINKSEIGNSTAFDLDLISLDGNADLKADLTGHFDETGYVTYNAQTVFTLSVAAAKATAAKAGGTWTIGIAAVRSDTNKTVGSEATVSCAGGAGTKRLVASHAIVTSSGVSVDTCTFTVPKADKHMKLHGTITVTDNGQTVTHSFSATAK